MEVHEHIVGFEQLVAIFGYWPSFHDSTVVWLRVDRQESPLGPGPTFEVMIHAFEMTNETDTHGNLVLRNHVLVHLRFAGVYDFRCDSFYRDYQLMELNIYEPGSPEPGHPLFRVDLNSVYGNEGIHFRCRRMEVASVTKCDQVGRPLP